MRINWSGKRLNMDVWVIETRHKDYNEFHITASYERAMKELSTAEDRDVGVIVTPYVVEDLEEKGLTLN